MDRSENMAKLAANVTTRSLSLARCALGARTAERPGPVAGMTQRRAAFHPRTA